MTFVEDNDIRARQLGIALQPPHQQPGRHNLDPGPGTDPPISPDRIPDRLPYRLTQQRGHPPRRRSRRQTPRLGHHHPPESLQRQRHQCRLPGSRRRDQYGGATLGQCRDNAVERATHRQIRKLGQFHCQPVCSPARRT